MKEIFFTKHAMQRMKDRNTNQKEIETAITLSKWKKAEKGRYTCSYCFPFEKEHFNNYYKSKEVVPIFIEEENKIIIITVYTYFSQKEV